MPGKIINLITLRLSRLRHSITKFSHKPAKAILTILSLILEMILSIAVGLTMIGLIVGIFLIASNCNSLECAIGLGITIFFTAYVYAFPIGLIFGIYYLCEMILERYFKK